MSRNLASIAERRRITPSIDVERAFWNEGKIWVAGLDEAGRGPWAGPVVAAAVVLPHEPARLAHLDGVRDSKTLSPLRRARLCDNIMRVAIAVGVGFSEVREIDALGIVPATRLAMQRALNGLAVAPEALIIDALTLPAVHLTQKAFPYADSLSLSVSAAGIVAKVTRDQWMVEMAEAQFPGYSFAQHKGYGTRRHREALDRLGVCELHRRSFRPIAEHIARGAR